MTCIKCGGSRISTETMSRYTDDGLVGLPNVTLLNAAQRHFCEDCGEDNGIYVPDVEGLEAAVAVARVMIPVKLIGREIRFLRNALGLKAKELCERLEVVAEGTVSRWENDKMPISPRDEKMLRLLAGRTLSSRAKAIGFDETQIFKGCVMDVPSITIEDDGAICFDWIINPTTMLSISIDGHQNANYTLQSEGYSEHGLIAVENLSVLLKRFHALTSSLP